MTGKSKEPKERVDIIYDQGPDETERAVKVPFIMGVMANLSGDNNNALGPADKRRFKDVTADTFDAFLKASKPRASFRVKNTMTGEGEAAVDLTFESMADFTPAAVAKRVGFLKDIWETREKLAYLLANADGNDKITEALEEVFKDPKFKALIDKAKS